MSLTLGSKVNLILNCVSHPIYCLLSNQLQGLSSIFMHFLLDFTLFYLHSFLLWICSYWMLLVKEALRFSYNYSPLHLSGIKEYTCRKWSSLSVLMLSSMVAGWIFFILGTNLKYHRPLMQIKWNLALCHIWVIKAMFHKSWVFVCDISQKNELILFIFGTFCWFVVIAQRRMDWLYSYLVQWSGTMWCWRM